MPRKKFAKKRPHKRYVRRKKNGKMTRYSKPTIDRMPGRGFADMMYVKLNYVQKVDLSTTGSPYIQYVFRGNSAYDPDETGTGHQPLYYDQYIQVYSKYRVLGSKIEVNLINNSGSSALMYIVNANTDVATSLTTISSLYEQSRSNAPKIVPIAARISSKYKQYASTRQVLGLTKSQVYDADLAASTGTSPLLQWYWNILLENLISGSDIDAHAVFKVTYYVQFFDKLLTGAS